jgi:DNA-binding response OmpR family regulator
MKKTILVVEKDEGILEIVNLILMDRGYVVKGLRSEKGAIEAILTSSPCAIILDIVAVTIEGTELCRLIREHPEIKHIPIIVLSTHPKAAEVKGVCADDVISKPFDIDDLIACVERQMVS